MEFTNESMTRYWILYNTKNITVNLTLIEQHDVNGFHLQTNQIPLSFSITATIYLTFVSLAIIMGNLLIILSIWKSSSFHKMTYFFLVSLAVSDLLNGVLTVPLYIGWLHNASLFSNPVACYFILSNSLFLSVASILNLLIVTLERFFAICYPFFYKGLFLQNKLTKVVVTCVWLTSLLMTLVSMTSRKDNFTKCSYISVFYPDFLLTAVVLGVFLPLSLMIAMYCRIFFVIRKHLSLILETVSFSPTGFRETRIKNNQTQQKISKTLFLVLFCFVFAWGPFFFVIFLHSVCESCKIPMIAFEIILIFAFTQSLANPLIYCLRHASFRKAVASILNCKHILAAQSEVQQISL